MSRSVRWATALVLVATSLIVVQAIAPEAGGARVAQAAPSGTVLRPVQPCRLFDARRTPDAGRLDASTWRIQVAGRCGVPQDSGAVAISMIAVEARGAGFVTAWSSGLARPTASNLNFAPGNTVANSAVVQLGTSGAIDVYLSADAALVVDVTAAFVDAGGEASSGRFVPTDPARLLDTRLDGRRGVSDLAVGLPRGVPADATALAVTVTAVNAAEPGFLTAFPAGTARPDASVVNTDRYNTTRASAAFLPVSASGLVVHRSMTTDVIVDVWGWFTGDTAAVSADGLFVPQAPTRVWDSRVTHDPIHPDGAVERRIGPAGASAIVANVTAVDATRAGFVSVFGAGTPVPDVSSLNYRWRQPVAALTVARVSDRGVGFSSYAGIHVLVDVAGWFTGTPTTATLPAPANPMSNERSEVLLISDSAFAGIRWNGALGYLQGAEFDARLESCRRLIGASCRGREGYAPRTAVAELSSVTPGRYSTVVILTGYNDSASWFPLAVDAVMAAARSKGIERVVWLTYRENVGYVSPSAISAAASFVANNAVLRAAGGSGAYPELILADWSSYSAGRSDWFSYDGVHLTVTGARAAAEYVSRVLASLERRPCPPALGGASSPGGWCADPDATGP